MGKLGKKSKRDLAETIARTGKRNNKVSDDPSMVSSAVHRLHAATVNRYEFKTGGMKGSSVDIFRIRLEDVALRSIPILSEFVPEAAELGNAIAAGEEVSEERAEALKARAEESANELRKALEESGQFTEDEKTKINLESIFTWIKIAISVIDLGCPDFSGRIHVTPQDLPRDASGNLKPYHFMFSQLQDDFMGLFEAIMKLSGYGGNRTEAVRTFP